MNSQKNWNTLVLTLLIAPIISWSQIVNIEAQRIKDRPEGLAGSVSFDFNISKEKRQLIILRPRAHIQYKKGKNLVFLLGEYWLSTVRRAGSKEDLSDKGFFHLRHNYKLNELIRWEVFTQGQYNKIRKLDFRGLIGTGPRFKFVDSEKFRLYGAPLYMFEYEEEQENVYHKNHRLSTYISITYEPNNSLKLVNTSYYQPRFDKLNDYRFVTNLSLSIKITSALSFNSYFELVHDSKPPPGVIQTSYDLLNGLKLAFQPKVKNQ